MGSQEITVQVPFIVCGGYAGRDRQKVQEHVDELATLGVAPPAEVPILFAVTADLATTAGHIDVQGSETSGEVEFVLLQVHGEWFVTVGSDQTDRELERFSIDKSKQICPKITGQALWPLREVSDHWDSLRLTSWVTKDCTRSLYQDEHLSALIAWQDLLRLVNERAPRALEDEALIFSGTIPTRSGLVFADLFEMEISDPVLKRSIWHQYMIRSLAGAGTVLRTT